MTSTHTTTPFGRRPVSLGQIAAQMQASRAIEAAGKPGSNQPAAVNKWALFRTLTEVKSQLGVSDRALSVLNALLTFQPETALSLPAVTGDGDAEPCCDLVVFPSNRALCLRAHGMAEATLRRHLAALVEAGLIIRRDSPNGKRYARKDQTGKERFSDAFGFDLTPLVARSAEFETMAEALRQAGLALKLTRERISLYRRDVAKLIACGLDEGLPGPWEAFRERFLALVTPLRRVHGDNGLAALEALLRQLRADVSKVLGEHVNSNNISGNDSQTRRHQSNSNTKPHTELEPVTRQTQGGGADLAEDTPAAAAPEAFPLGMVLDACPDAKDYAANGAIRTWPEFFEAARLIRPLIGISPDAWREAIAALGETGACIAVAAILQRSEHSSEAAVISGREPGSAVTVVNGSPAIKSAGGYLRALTEKARAGEFALGPVLMALIGQRLKAKRAKLTPAGGPAA